MKFLRAFLAGMVALSPCAPTGATMTDLGWPVQVPPYWQLFDAEGIGTLLIDAADEKVGAVFNIGAPVTVAKIGFGTGTVTTGATVDVRLETVDLTTGAPSGTLATTNSNASQVIADTDDNVWFEVTLTASHSATAGQMLAIVIVNPSGSPGNINIKRGFTSAATGSAIVGFSGTWHYQASWGRTSGTHGMYLESDGGQAIYTGSSPAITQTSVSFNNGSTPDERGNIFQFSVPVSVCGATSTIEPNAADFDLVLYDSDGSTALRTVSIDGSFIENRVNPDRTFYVSFEPVTLTASTNYRIAFKPTSGSSVEVMEFAVNDAEVLDAFGGGQTMHKTTRTNAGSWTEVTTSRLDIGLLICGFDNGAGGGSAVNVLGLVQ